MFIFSSQTEAKKAIKAINLAIKEYYTNKPYPEWAKIAIENGWKQPKGWKP
jgi:hypothetical protein